MHRYNENCAAILGMKYFGEHKKGTLTMAWALANRNGYASCHGGQKEWLIAVAYGFGFLIHLNIFVRHILEVDNSWPRHIS